MKKYSLVFIAALFSMTLFSQEETETPAGGSLIDDIMNVDVVNINPEEGFEEEKADYEKKYEDAVSKLDQTYTKINDVYKKEVGGLIEDFTKVLAEGEELPAKSKKKSVVSRIRTLSMTLKVDKKKALQEFDNSMKPLIRELPEVFHKAKTDELNEKSKEDLGNFESEYTANLASLDAFKSKEHLVISDAPAASDSDSEQ